MIKNNLCPFSKPLVGGWCQCPYARAAERCSGKMECTRVENYHASCVALVDAFKENSRFVLGISNSAAELTHTQLMKIRCGGLKGMRRVLNLESDEPPVVRDVIAAAATMHGSIDSFPFNEIVRDIKTFQHRNKKQE